jgi:hypothetical protein
MERSLLEVAEAFTRKLADHLEDGDFGYSYKEYTEHMTPYIYDFLLYLKETPTWLLLKEK